MRSAWNVRVAGSRPGSRFGIAARTISASSAVVASGRRRCAAAIAARDAPCETFLAQRLDQRRQLPLRQPRDEVGGGFALAAHPHVERAILAKRKSARAPGRAASTTRRGRRRCRRSAPARTARSAAPYRRTGRRSVSAARHVLRQAPDRARPRRGRGRCRTPGSAPRRGWRRYSRRRRKWRRYRWRRRAARARPAPRRSAPEYAAARVVFMASTGVRRRAAGSCRRGASARAPRLCVG